MANSWLKRSGPEAAELEKEIDSLRHTTGSDIQVLYKRGLDFMMHVLGVSNPRKDYGGFEGLRKAEVYLQREIKDLRERLGKDHALGIELTRSSLSIKDLLEKTGEAEEMCWDYKLASEKVFGREHPSTAVAIILLSRFSLIQNKWDQAENLAVAAMQTCVNTVGHESPHTRAHAVWENLAQVIQHMGRYTKRKTNGKSYQKPLNVMINVMVGV